MSIPCLLYIFQNFLLFYLILKFLQDFFVIQKFIDLAFLLLFILSNFSVMGCLYLKKAFCMSQGRLNAMTNILQILVL